MSMPMIRQDFRDNLSPMFTPPMNGEDRILVHFPSLHENISDSHNSSVNATVSPFRDLNASELEICLNYERLCIARLIMNVFIIGPMCLAGIVGNLLAILALRLDHSNRTVTFLLQALAVADNGYLVFSLFTQTLKSAVECSSNGLGLGDHFPYWEIYLWPLASMAQTITVWFTVLVTVDRYIAICRPFESMRHHVNVRAKRAVYFIVCFAVIYNLPRFFEREVNYLPDYCKRIYRHVSQHTPLRQNQYYILYYKTVMYFIFRMIIPMGTLIILNLKLIQTVRRARHDQAQLTQATATQRTNYYFNVILVAIVSVFIVCQAPDFVLRILLTIKSYAKLKLEFSLPVLFTNMLLTVNSSANCLLYCLTGRKFRQILYRILCRPCSRQHIAMDDVRYGNSETSFNRRATTTSGVNETCL